MKIEAVSFEQLSPAAQFFYRHAGWNYNPVTETPDQGKLRCAQSLADAEAAASAAGVQFRWEQDDITNREHTDEGNEYFLWQCIAYHGEKAIGSLSGVDFGEGAEPWGNPYARVVQAEIVCEWENYAGEEPDDE